MRDANIFSPAQLASPSELEEWLARVRSALAAKIKGLACRLSIDGESVDLEAHPGLLPSPGEGLARYGNRPEFRGKRWGLVVNNLQTVSRELAFRSEKVLADCVQTADADAFATSGLFVGNYRRSPFGVHRDPGHRIVHIPIVGGRRTLLWDGDHVFHRHVGAAPENALDYQRDVGAATVLEVAVGEAAFWHGDCWHAIETDHDEVSAAISLSVVEEASIKARAPILKRINWLANQVCDAAGVDDSPDVAASVGDLADQLSDRLRTMAKDLAAEVWLKRARHRTAFGFGVPLAHGPGLLSASGEHVRGRSRQLEWCIDGDALRIVASGTPLTVSVSAKNVELLQALKAGVAIDWTHLGGEELYLLDMLVRCQAVETAVNVAARTLCQPAR